MRLAYNKVCTIDTILLAAACSRTIHNLTNQQTHYFGGSADLFDGKENQYADIAQTILHFCAIDGIIKEDKR